MRKSIMISCIAIVLVFGLRIAPSAQAPAAASAPAYLTPPKVIADIMDAEPLPGVVLSPDRKMMLLSHRRSMPTIAEVSAPFYRLAGIKVNTAGIKPERTAELIMKLLRTDGKYL